MLLTSESLPDVLENTQIKCWKDERFTAAWYGYAWYPSHKAGENSIAAIVKELYRRPLSAIIGKLKGIYGLFIYDSHTNMWSASVDPSGLFRLYYAKNVISTRFLDIAEFIGARIEDLVPEHVVGYLAHGAVFGEETFLRDVRNLRGDEMISFRVGKHEEIRICEKERVVPSGNPDELLEAFIRALGESLEGRKLSIDLTGGLDSRVLTCLCFYHGLPFETSISGREDSPDVVIARDIAMIIGRDFHCTPHRIEQLDDDLPAAFEVGDSHIDVVHFHRPYQHARARLRRGVDLMMHGGGGELFRDHTFAHEFPRYGSRQSNLARLYRLRGCPIALPSRILTNKARDIVREAPQKAINIIRRYIGKTNNETCDRVYFYLKSPEFWGPFYTSYIHMGLEVVAPMLDRETVEAVIQTSPWKRFFAQWHRQMLTRHCPTLARMRTVNGITASALWSDMICDSGQYFMIQVRRAGRKVAERLLGRSMFYHIGARVGNHPEYVETVRRTRTLERAVRALQEIEILAPTLRPTDIPKSHLGRILTAGLLVERLGKASRRVAESGDAITERC